MAVLFPIAFAAACEAEPGPTLDVYRRPPPRGPAILPPRAAPDVAPPPPMRRPAGDLADPGLPPVTFRMRNVSRQPRSVTRLAGAAEVRIEQPTARGWIVLQTSAGSLRPCEDVDRRRIGDLPPASSADVPAGGTTESTWRGYLVSVARGHDAQPCAQTMPAMRGHYRATVFGCGPVEFDQPPSAQPVEIPCR